MGQSLTWLCLWAALGLGWFGVLFIDRMYALHQVSHVGDDVASGDDLEDTLVDAFETVKAKVRCGRTAFVDILQPSVLRMYGLFRVSSSSGVHGL